MTALPIPSGPTNRQLVDLAFLALGMTDTMFGRTPEELASAGELLRGMMAEWPFDQLGFDDEQDAGLRLEEESGIDRKWSQAVALSLAERIGPSIGRAMPAEAIKARARSYARLCAAVSLVCTVKLAAGTPLGAGRRYRFGSFATGQT